MPIKLAPHVRVRKGTKDGHMGKQTYYEVAIVCEPLTIYPSLGSGYGSAMDHDEASARKLAEAVSVALDINDVRWE